MCEKKLHTNSINLIYTKYDDTDVQTYATVELFAARHAQLVILLMMQRNIVVLFAHKPKCRLIVYVDAT